MKRGTIILIVVVLVIVLAVSNAIGRYNTLVGLEEGVTAAWSQVENVYQRRADLIPNLVATVKGFAEQEQEVFIGVTEARSKVNQINLGGVTDSQELLNQFQAAQGGLSSALSRLLVTVERYPDIKSNQNFLDLQAQLEGTENRIAVERRRYNEVAQAYNTSVRRFPNSLYAGIFGFERKAYFQADSGADAAPKVEF